MILAMGKSVGFCVIEGNHIPYQVPLVPRQMDGAIDYSDVTSRHIVGINIVPDLDEAAIDFYGEIAYFRTPLGVIEVPIEIDIDFSGVDVSAVYHQMDRNVYQKQDKTVQPSPNRAVYVPKQDYGKVL